MVEHLLCKQGVVGSTPSASTIVREHGLVLRLGGIGRCGKAGLGGLCWRHLRMRGCGLRLPDGVFFVSVKRLVRLWACCEWVV